MLACYGYYLERYLLGLINSILLQVLMYAVQTLCSQRILMCEPILMIPDSKNERKKIARPTQGFSEINTIITF